MFGISGVELLLLIVLGVVIFGPERLPELSRKAARIFVYLRGIANNAQSTLRTELGPEFSDFTLQDLNPKTFVRKHLANEVQALEDAQREIMEAGKSLEDATKLATQEAGSAAGALTAAPSPTAVAATLEPTPYDPEAT